MKKLIIYIFLIGSIFAEEPVIKELLNDRPKIGLVLSGGAAKGYVHLGVLKILEENHIPIDYISGSSIGALIGVLYSVGYTTSDIEKIVKTMDPNIFSADNINREDLPMEEKIFSERYALSLPLKNYKIVLPQSLIAGQNVYMKLKNFLWETRKTRDFNKLPIPVHISTTNINTGEECVLTEGDLVKALSASMALPAFFHPIKWSDDIILTDGLSSNNFPVEEVKKMGADIIIGVNISAPLANMEDLNFITVINQLQYYRSFDKTKLQREKVDILIEPDTSSYFPLDFSKSKELISLGEKTALLNLNKIKSFVSNSENLQNDSFLTPKGQIESALVNEVEIKGLKNVDKSFVNTIIKKKAPFYISKDELEDIIKRLYAFNFFERVYYEFLGDKLTFTFEEKISDKLHLGFNYKNIDGKSQGKLILGATLNGLGVKNNKTNVDLTIAQDPTISLRNYIYSGKGILGKFGLLSTFNYKKDNFYLSPETSYPTSSFEKFELDFLVGTITGKRNLLGAGLNFQEINFDDNSRTLTNEKNVDCYVKWTYDSYNKTVFPNKGTYIKYNAAIDFANLFQDEKLYNSFGLYANNYSPITKNVSLITSFNSANITGNNIPLTKYPEIKGMIEAGQDFSFYGLDSKGIKTKFNALFQLGLKMDINENLFVSSIYNEGFYINLNDEYKSISGYGISVGRNTPLGPLYLNYVRSENDYHIYLNFGYEF